MTRRIDISYKTIIFIVFFLILLWIIFQILDILLLFFVAFIFMSALAPLVDQLTKRKIPRVVATLLVFFTTLLALVGLLTFGLTPLVTETISLSQRLSEAIGSLLQTNFIDQSIIKEELSNWSGQFVNITFSAFQNIISMVSILVITIYMMLDRAKIENYATSFFTNRQEQARRILRSIEDKLGAWLRGQVILSLAVAILVYIGLLILGIEAALPLAIIAGFLEVVPVIGPIIAAIPAVLLALTVSPVLAGIVAGLYFAIQEVEGHVLVPQIMKKAVGLNPLLVILAILIGGRLLGIGGALLAVPLAVVIQIILQEFLKPKEE
ncbi:MAG: AI-2E family transporter [Candidatus Daviesbacteria bacterium]